MDLIDFDLDKDEEAGKLTDEERVAFAMRCRCCS